MSRLDELIAELCPDGVEYKPLESILKIKNGSDYKGFPEGNIPVYGSGGIMTYIDRFAFDRPSVLIPRKGSIDKLYYVEEPFWNVDTIFYTDIDIRIAIPKYVFHCLLRANLAQYNTAGGVPSLTQKVLNKVKIPVPPLPVQQEIVRILDHFIELTAELQKQLDTELTARKKQYEYYRDMLFHSLSCKYQRNVKMNDICIFVSVGIANSATHAYADSGVVMFRNQNIKENYLDDEDVIYITTQFANQYQEKKLKENDILVTRTGYPGIACLVPRQYEGSQTFTTLIARLKNFSETDPKYISYYINSGFGKSYVNRMKAGAAQQNFGATSLGKMDVILPPIKEQHRIVSILDRFDSLCNDLTFGLPAEIAARQKQYEYYRDKLLTFPEKG